MGGARRTCQAGAAAGCCRGMRLHEQWQNDWRQRSRLRYACNTATSSHPHAWRRWLCRFVRVPGALRSGGSVFVCRLDAAAVGGQGKVAERAEQRERRSRRRWAWNWNRIGVVVAEDAVGWHWVSGRWVEESVQRWLRRRAGASAGAGLPTDGAGRQVGRLGVGSSRVQCLCARAQAVRQSK